MVNPGLLKFGICTPIEHVRLLCFSVHVMCILLSRLDLQCMVCRGVCVASSRTTHAKRKRGGVGRGHWETTADPSVGDETGYHSSLMGCKSTIICERAALDYKRYVVSCLSRQTTHVKWRGAN